MPVDMAHPTR